MKQSVRFQRGLERHSADYFKIDSMFGDFGLLLRSRYDGGR
jgi:hypothetical protein